MNLTKQQKTELLDTLKKRFESNLHRHPNLQWEQVLRKIEENAVVINQLQAMEETGGAPDVVELPSLSKWITFIDCSKESPAYRRSLCYDLAAHQARKEHKPPGDAESMAKSMGVSLLDEEQYIELQNIEDFDLKTSSWLETGKDFRKLGGAVFGEKRYKRCFIFHNGVQSYYAARGFRAIIAIGEI